MAQLNTVVLEMEVLLIARLQQPNEESKSGLIITKETMPVMSRDSIIDS